MSLPNTTLAAGLRELGPAPARDPESFRLGTMAPGIAIAPAQRSDVGAALRLLSEENGACVPWGGGIQQDPGFLPTRYDAAISTENLNRLVDLEPGDLTVTVEAGMTLSTLQEILARNSQFVALESVDPARETIGGLLATGSSALIRYGYGTPRDQVIGITVAMPDGSLVHGGGRVVKNVAGYDLCKLFTGSLGTLGIIVEATFRVRPLPAAHRTWVGTFPSSDAAEEALAALMDSPLQPTFLQAADPNLFAELVSSTEDTGCLPVGMGTGYWALLLGADGDEILSQWMIAEATSIAAPVQHTAVAGDADIRLRQTLTSCCGPQTDLCAKVAVLSSDVFPLIEACRQYVSETEGLSLRSTAAAGNGVVYLHFSADPSGGDAAPDWSTIVEQVMDQAAARRGAAMLLRSPSADRARLPVWGRPAATWPLMSQIRKQLDPKDTMNRGRFIPNVVPK